MRQLFGVRADDQAVRVRRLAVPGVLRLEARDYDGPARWRWVLTDSSGAFLADHEVRIDEHSWQYEAFTDLQHYISWHAAPDQYAEDEARIVAEVGQWMGSEVFGAVADALARAARKTPVTVRVVVQAGAETLLFRPLELAHAGGRPLSARDVMLVMQTAGDDSACDAVPVGDRLRVLGLFSLPEGGQPLNLRRERHALVQLINRIAAHGKAAEVRVLQYGVTRERLREVLEEAEGWDVIHISGHGAPGELLLETTVGTPDKVTAAELADLLEPARDHVKLVTVAACWSAAVTAAQQRRLLGLPIPKTHFPERAGGDSSSPGNFATELTERLGCAVLAMRYPVADDFAIELSEKLYDLLAAKGQPLARAVGMTVRELTAGNRFPALSAATPALFGGCAAELKLAAPRRTGPPSYRTGELKMAGFPPQPERFVGRTGVMARASAALADESGMPGVLLHGIPGGGKTACALELAYTHEHAFDRLVWYKAPDEGMEISGALTDFALTLERYLEGFQMVHLVSDADKLAGFLPRLTELMERSRLLLVIDNAESLLTETGRWRDDQWGQMIGALTAHRGLGRMIVTSRRTPGSSGGAFAASRASRVAGTSDAIARSVSAETSGLRVESVDALSADEALLLARELPHLKKLINGEISGLGGEELGGEDVRKLALGVLNVAQGHPKLLELADGQAAHPERLADLVAAGDQAWREQGGLPDGFFATGQTTADPSDYLHVLAAWTKAVTDTLSPAERDLFWFLCCLEERDRERFIIDEIWPPLWNMIGRSGQPPGLDRALTAIASRGLVAFQVETSGANESYAFHPGVAAAGRTQAGKFVQDAVDTVAAAFWDQMYQMGLERANDGSVHTDALVRIGRSAVPYLLRLRRWEDAAVLLDSAFIRDRSPVNAAAMLPAIQQISRHHPWAGIISARLLGALDPAAAEKQLRTCLDEVVICGDYPAASAAAGQLVDLCRLGGRLAEALTFAEQQFDYVTKAGHGPWTQLASKAQQLRVLTEMGKASQVLAEFRRLREHVDGLAAIRGPNEYADPWRAREMLFEIGREAALRLDRWQHALDLNAPVLASMHDRSAPAAEIARARFNNCCPLLRLDRVEEALDLLLDCRRIFRDVHDIRMLGRTIATLADAEDERGHGEVAIRLARDALRYGYLAGDLVEIARHYHDLGTFLARNSRQPALALANHLAAGLICTIAAADGIDIALHDAARDLFVFGTDAEPPTDVADLCRKIGDIPGTDLVGLFARLSPDPETAERTLRELIAQARESAETLPEDAAPQ
jgi:CHAT domain-containing protein